METISPVLDTIAIIIDIFSVIVITYGVALCAKDFIITRFTLRDSKESFIATTLIKNQLASYILLSLEILIAADIIETIVSPTLTDISFLAATVVIRTVISYFLNKEIKESNLQDDLN